MEHNLHNAPLHWGYNAASVNISQNHWTPPPQQRSSLKRALSESDCDELYSEESSKEQISPGEPGSCQLMSRKKRRGVIEKKRRDRINSSLSELKRLVPSAYEKQGSAKLEKAEILQLTVEHLKNLHAKGIDTLSYDPQRFAMDYHIIGFRECAAEVARYLVTIEGMDIQDPLRLRLMSHLQYFVQQRELSAKSCASPGASWTSPAPNASYQSNCAAAPYHQSYGPAAYVPNLAAPIQPYPTLSSPPTTHIIHHQQSPAVHGSHPNASSVAAPSETMPLMNNPPAPQSQPTHRIQPQTQGLPPQTQPQPSGHESHHQQQQQQQQHYAQDSTHQEHQGATYIELTSSQANAEHHSNLGSPSANPLNYGGTPAEYPVSVGQVYSPNSGLSYVAANGSKPYRPWGAEMAY